MPSLEINEARLDYVERGSGDPLVLVHGSASDRRTWDCQLAALSRRHRVVAYSRRYHWPNQPIPRGGDYSMPEHVADLEALVHRLELSPAHLIGHSYGGFVCLLLAIMRPETVRSLVLVEAPVFPLVIRIPPGPRDILKLLLTKPRMAPAVARFGARGLAPAIATIKRGDRDEALRLLGSAILGEQAFRRLSHERLSQARANLIDAELLGSLFPSLTAEQVRAVRCPTLLVTGDRSPPVHAHLASVLGRLLPYVERAGIASASHLVHEDNPSAFASAVLAFLSQRVVGPEHADRPTRPATPPTRPAPPVSN